MGESNRTPYVRAALPADAEVIAAMAVELAAALEDSKPDFDAARFIRDGFGPDRWFECLVAEIEGQPVGYALMCRASRRIRGSGGFGSATSTCGRRGGAAARGAR